MKKLVGICVWIICISLMPISVFAQIDTFSELQEYYHEQKANLREQVVKGIISSSEYDKCSMQLQIECQQIRTSSPEIAKNTLSYQKSDTFSNRMEAQRYVTTARDKQSLLQYYADSQGCIIEDLTVIPQFTFSEPIALSDQDSMLTLQNGKMEAEWFQQYVRAWAFVGYADGNPYAVFSVNNESDGSYLLDTVYPSAEQARRFHALLNVRGCYVLSGITAKTIPYVVMNENIIESVCLVDVSDGSKMILADQEKNAAIYFRAYKISADHNLEVQYEDAAGKIGGSNGTYISYIDVWNRAFFDLYIRPYLIPTVIVFAVGAAVAVVIIRKRKQNKA